jgi:uncharacterized protein
VYLERLFSGRFQKSLFPRCFAGNRMKIQVLGLSEGLHEYTFEALPGDVGLPAEFTGQVTARVELDKTPTELSLSAQVRGRANLECDRCTAPYQEVIDARYRMMYVWDGENASLFDPSELQVVPAGFSVIDITDDVRQTLLLAVPFKRVCREQCKGLCPHCGKNLNEGSCDCKVFSDDSRWEKLRELKTSKNDEV